MKKLGVFFIYSLVGALFFSFSFVQAISVTQSFSYDPLKAGKAEMEACVNGGTAFNIRDYAADVMQCQGNRGTCAGYSITGNLGMSYVRWLKKNKKTKQFKGTISPEGIFVSAHNGFRYDIGSFLTYTLENTHKNMMENNWETETHFDGSYLVEAMKNTLSFVQKEKMVPKHSLEIKKVAMDALKENDLKIFETARDSKDVLLSAKKSTKFIESKRAFFKLNKSFALGKLSLDEYIKKARTVNPEFQVKYKKEGGGVWKDKPSFTRLVKLYEAVASEKITPEKLEAEIADTAWGLAKEHYPRVREEEVLLDSDFARNLKECARASSAKFIKRCRRLADNKKLNFDQNYLDNLQLANLSPDSSKPCNKLERRKTFLSHMCTGVPVSVAGSWASLNLGGHAMQATGWKPEERDSNGAITQKAGYIFRNSHLNNQEVFVPEASICELDEAAAFIQNDELDLVNKNLELVGMKKTRLLKHQHGNPSKSQAPLSLPVKEQVKESIHSNSFKK